MAQPQQPQTWNEFYAPYRATTYVPGTPSVQTAARFSAPGHLYSDSIPTIMPQPFPPAPAPVVAPAVPWAPKRGRGNGAIPVVATQQYQYGTRYTNLRAPSLLAGSGVPVAVPVQNGRR